VKWWGFVDIVWFFVIGPWWTSGRVFWGFWGFVWGGGRKLWLWEWRVWGGSDGLEER